MKLILAALTLTYGLLSAAPAFAARGDEVGEGGPTAAEAQKTEGGSADAVMCLGGCESNTNTTNINYSPYQVDKDWNTIMQDRSVIKPEDSGAKREHWDL